MAFKAKRLKAYKHRESKPECPEGAERFDL